MSIVNQNGLKSSLKYSLIAFTLILFGCHTTVLQQNENIELDRHSQYQEAYQQSLVSFKNSIVKLQEAAEKGFITTEYDDGLLSFHSIGFLMEYFDNSLYALINGAPVYREDESTPGAQIVSPHGFQVIAEILADEEIDFKSLNDEILLMQHQLDYYNKTINSTQIDEQSVINAAANLIIRLETLTITDFENNGEALSKRVFEVQIKSIHQYLDHIVSDTLLLELPSILANYDDKLSLIHYINQYKLIITPLTSNFLGVSPVNQKAANIYDEHFLEATYFGNSGINKSFQPEKIALGKKLFNDPLLSHNRSFSCASCHQPNLFFTDGLKLSNSNFTNTSLKRNTPTVIHASYQSKYMYDGRSASLEDQMLHVFNNPKEFKSSTTDIVKRIKEDSSYVRMFSILYHDMVSNAINLNSVTDALATYIRSLTAHQSPFDKYMRGEPSNWSLSAQNGFNLFMGKAKCGSCHFAPTFSGLAPPFYKESELENIGVPMMDEKGNWLMDTDYGRYDFYPNKAFMYFFKTPTLRNIAMTAPYMHNGVFNTLEEVMEFYNNGGGVGHNLSYKNQTLPTDSLGLNESEITDIIQFMESLTDATIINY
ncbi:MAG: cytochrome c peroxidase [Chitinophagales bacterium]